jgi:hypothetical protein
VRDAIALLVIKRSVFLHPYAFHNKVHTGSDLTNPEELCTRASYTRFTESLELILPAHIRRCRRLFRKLPNAESDQTVLQMLHIRDHATSHHPLKSCEAHTRVFRLESSYTNDCCTPQAGNAEKIGAVGISRAPSFYPPGTTAPLQPAAASTFSSAVLASHCSCIRSYSCA